MPLWWHALTVNDFDIVCNTRPVLNREMAGIHIKDVPCLMTSPGTRLISNARSSKCLIAIEPPPSAVKRSTSTSVIKSVSCRLNRSCGFSSMTITTSPVWAPGAWSLSPLNCIVCPPFIPLSTWTSSSFFSGRTFFPLQLLHRSLALIISPDPEHSSQGDCICWIMGPIWRRVTLTPRPLQVLHVRTAPSLPPFPLHLEQSAFRVKASFVVLPL